MSHIENHLRGGFLLFNADCAKQNFAVRLQHGRRKRFTLWITLKNGSRWAIWHIFDLWYNELEIYYM